MVIMLDRRGEQVSMQTIYTSPEQHDLSKDEEPSSSVRKTRHRLPSDESITSISGTPLAKKMRTRINDD